MSMASNRSLTTASMSAPAASTAGALSSVMPPMAATGNLHPALGRGDQLSGARVAPGLVGETNMLPMAT